VPAPFFKMTPDEFDLRVEKFVWTRPIWRIDMHHTWYPSHSDYCGLESIEKMRAFHVNERKWDDIAQHVSIAPDGMIWTGRDWNKMPASVGFGLNRDVFMFETIGNFDIGHDRLEGAQLASVLRVISAVQYQFGLPAESLLFHREIPLTEKTCPGSSVDKGEILGMLRGFKAAA